MDTWTDGHTPTDKPRTNAMATLMHPAGAPHRHSTLPVARDPWPPNLRGEMGSAQGWGGGSSPSHTAQDMGGAQPPTLPQGMASWEGSPMGPGAPDWGQIAGSLPHLPLHPLTCHNARPLLQSTRSWGQHAVPPTRCCTAWHHPSSQSGLCESPQDQVFLAHSAGTGKTRPYAKGGLGDACRAQHHVQDAALAASPAWGRPCTPS